MRWIMRSQRQRSTPDEWFGIFKFMHIFGWWTPKCETRLKFRCALFHISFLDASTNSILLTPRWRYSVDSVWTKKIVFFDLSDDDGTDFYGIETWYVEGAERVDETEKMLLTLYLFIFSRDAFKWQNLFGASRVAKSSAFIHLSSGIWNRTCILRS